MLLIFFVYLLLFLRRRIKKFLRIFYFVFSLEIHDLGPVEYKKVVFTGCVRLWCGQPTSKQPEADSTRLENAYDLRNIFVINVSNAPPKKPQISNCCYEHTQSHVPLFVLETLFSQHFFKKCFGVMKRSEVVL